MSKTIDKLEKEFDEICGRWASCVYPSQKKELKSLIQKAYNQGIKKKNYGRKR